MDQRRGSQSRNVTVALARRAVWVCVEQVEQVALRMGLRERLLSAACMVRSTRRQHAALSGGKHFRHLYASGGRGVSAVTHGRGAAVHRRDSTATRKPQTADRVSRCFYLNLVFALSLSLSPCNI